MTGLFCCLFVAVFAFSDLKGFYETSIMIGKILEPQTGRGLFSGSRISVSIRTTRMS
jgi:hypothetical protein